MKASVSAGVRLRPARLLGLAPGFLQGLFALIFLFSVSSQAKTSEQDELRVYAEAQANRLSEKFRQEKPLYYEDRERFFAEWEVTLDEVVDFRRFAGRVMGRYARQASPAQRQKFVERFKRSLMETYARAMIEAEGYVVQMSGVEINAQDASRASVSFDVVAPDGKRNAVVYSMFKNNDHVWMTENIIVEGINIGLAFREKFDREMETSRGDLDLVIDNWTSRVEQASQEDQRAKAPAQTP